MFLKKIQTYNKVSLRVRGADLKQRIRVVFVLYFEGIYKVIF